MEQRAAPDRSDAPAGEREWREELRQQQSQVDALRERLVEVKVGMRSAEDDSRRELDHLCRRVKTIATLLAFVIYPCVILWVFATSSARRACVGVAATCAVLGMVLWLVGGTA